MPILDGESVVPRSAGDAKKLIGKYVRYLRHCDIDDSGRGYVFPQGGIVTDQYKRNLEINGNLVRLSTFVEVNVIREATEEELDIYR